MKNKRTHKTKYKDSYRYVILRIWGNNLDPENITKRLAIQPSDSWKKGTYISKSGRKYKKDYGQWILESNVRENATFELRIKNIIEQIEPHKRAMKNILREYKADLKIVVTPHDEVAVWGHSFNSELINFFTELGIDITFAFDIPDKFNTLTGVIINS